MLWSSGDLVGQEGCGFTDEGFAGGFCSGVVGGGGCSITGSAARFGSRPHSTSCGQLQTRKALSYSNEAPHLNRDARP